MEGHKKSVKKQNKQKKKTPYKAKKKKLPLQKLYTFIWLSSRCFTQMLYVNIREIDEHKENKTKKSIHLNWMITIQSGQK